MHNIGNSPDQHLKYCIKGTNYHDDEGRNFIAGKDKKQYIVSVRQPVRVRSDSRHQALFSGEIFPGDRGLLFLYFFQGKITGKELDTETGYYYFGARYLDPKTSRWISADPAMGEYIPSAPVNDEARKRNGNLPGQGGVFNYVNLHVYHYAGNNPVKYTDPDGTKNYVIIAMFPGGGSENVGTTFVDAAETRKKEIESSSEFNGTEDTVTVYTVDSVKELKDIVNKGDIDQLDIFSHGGESWLVAGSGEGPGKREYLKSSDLNEFNKDSFNPGATINLFGCTTASNSNSNPITRFLGTVTIAESIALHFKGTTVTGFTGGAMAVPSPDAKTDINFKHKRGEPVWYKSASGTRSYKYDK